MAHEKVSLVSSLGIGFHGLIRLTINNLPLDRNGANTVWWESVGWWLNQLCKSAHVDSIFKPMIDLLSDYGKLLHSPIWCLSTNGACLTHLLRKYNCISKTGNYFSWKFFSFFCPFFPFFLFFFFYHSTILHVWFYYLVKIKLLWESYLILEIHNFLLIKILTSSDNLIFLLIHNLCLKKMPFEDALFLNVLQLIPYRL